MNTIEGVLTHLLENLGSRAEIEQYLREFGGVESTKFAVIKVGGGTIQRDMDTLASSLVFLRRVGLFPIVVHGAGPQLDRALSRAGLDAPKQDGLRVTPPEVLGVVRRVVQEVNLSLCATLERRGVRARPVVSGVFEAEPIDAARYGLVGDIDAVHLQPIHAAIRSEQLPVVACLGETAGGQILNVNADVAARELAISVQPYKVVFLTPTGGLLDAEGRIVPAINLDGDLDAVLAAGGVTDGMALKLREIAMLLDALPPASSVSITSPRQLARELFTHRGSGTLVRRGDPIDQFDDLDGVDEPGLVRLVESAFGRPLRPGALRARPVKTVLVSRSGAAAALVTDLGGRSYLDKFAVTPEAQGKGLGALLWRQLRDTCPQLFWRSRLENPITPWYLRHADGARRQDGWIVFWYGMDDAAEIAACVEQALALPDSFTDPATTTDRSLAHVTHA